LLHFLPVRVALAVHTVNIYAPYFAAVLKTAAAFEYQA